MFSLINHDTFWHVIIWKHTYLSNTYTYTESPQTFSPDVASNDDTILLLWVVISVEWPYCCTYRVLLYFQPGEWKNLPFQLFTILLFYPSFGSKGLNWILLIAINNESIHGFFVICHRCIIFLWCNINIGKGCWIFPVILVETTVQSWNSICNCYKSLLYAHGKAILL